MNDKPTIPEMVENTESVVHQTYSDLQDIGIIADHTKETTESISKRVNQIIWKLKHQEEATKQVIKQEIAEQMKPYKDLLDRILLDKPQSFYLVPKVPGFLRHFFKFVPKFPK